MATKTSGSNKKNNIVVERRALDVLAVGPALTADLRSNLNGARFKIFCAKDFVEAKNILETLRFDIMIIDIDGNRDADLAKLLENHPEMDVVAVDDTPTKAAFHAGPSRILEKPYAPAELQALFMDLWERWLLKDSAYLSGKRLEVQNSLSAELSKALTPDDVAWAAIEAGRQLAQVPMVMCAADSASSDEGSELTVRPLAWAGIDDDTAIAITKALDIQGRLARQTASIVEFKPTPKDLDLEFDLVALVRLRGQSRDLGALIVAVGPQQALDEHHWDLVEAMSNWVGVALERTLLYRHLERSFEEANRIQRKLIQTEKHAAIGRLTAGLAHEIGTPLNIISGRAELLLEQFGDREPAMVQGLTTINNQIERISKLVANLLNYARESKPALQWCSLSTTLTAVLDLLKRPLAQAMIDIDVQLPDDIPQIVAPPDQMQQVLLNLLLNCVDAIETDPAHGNIKRRGQINIDAEFIAKERQLRVRIQDNGQGIRADDLDKVFEPFYTTKPVGAGTGLGLSVVYGIINDLHGTITIESAPEVGTLVIINMPTEPLEGWGWRGDK